MATSSVTKFTRPATIVVICLYAPAATTPDADRVRDHLFSGVSAYLDTLPKSAHVFVCGDYNALLRKGDVDCLFSRNPISRHPVARNAREELIDFCGANQLSVANGRKCKHHSQLTTHRRPNGQCVTIDYILVRNRFRSSVHNIDTK